MPARHLGFSKGSAASLQALLPLDFLLPVSRTPVVARRRYARVALQELEAQEEPETTAELLHPLSQWDDRTGEAVGEGSSAGTTRSDSLELRRNGRVVNARRGSGNGEEGRETRHRKVAPPAAAPFAFSNPTLCVEHDLSSPVLKPKASKDRREALRISRIVVRDHVEKVALHEPVTSRPALPALDELAPTQTTPSHPHTLSSRLFGNRTTSTTAHTPSNPVSPSSRANPSASDTPVPDLRSFTHKHLSRRDCIPPSASAIFDHLAERKSLATPRALTPLIGYSRRTGHYLVQLRAGEVRARLASQYRIIGDEGVYGYDRLPGEAVEGQTLGVKGWAGKAYPPRRVSLPLDVDQALRNLHYRLISVNPKNPAPRPPEVVDQLRSLCAAEERGRDGLVEALSAVLNLYVIYAERSLGPGTTMPTLRSVLALCPELKPTKQTLHLVVQGLLWPNELDYMGPTSPTDDAALPPRRKVRIPSDVPDVRARLEDVLEWFQTTHNVFPGTETFRDMLVFASVTDDPVLASVAFDGWWIADSAQPGLTPGEGDHARFLHCAQRWRKFRHVLRMLTLRGWVRVVSGEGRARRERYAWCGPSERGVDDVAGWEAMSAEERADVRAKRDKWAARDKGLEGAVVEEPERDAEAELARWKIARAREKRKKRPGAEGRKEIWREEDGLGEGEGRAGKREEVWW